MRIREASMARNATVARRARVASGATVACCAMADHVHLVLMIPPKVAVSDLLGRLKGQTSMRMFHEFRHLKRKPYWGNHFWAQGYCVDTVLDADMIRKYVCYQEKKEQQMEQLRLID